MENLTVVPNPISNELLAKVISHNTEDTSVVDWAHANIESIQHVVRSGNHDTMFYPDSGTDLVRTAHAYDLTNLIAVDNDESIPSRVIDQLRALTIPFKVETDEKNYITTIDVVDGSKTRKITILSRNSRSVYSDIQQQPPVDILHIYFPMSEASKTDLNEADSNVSETGHDIESRLTVDNYKLVSINGFFCV